MSKWRGRKRYAEEREWDKHTWKQNMLVSSVKKTAMPASPYSIRVLLPNTSTRITWEREGDRRGRARGKVWGRERKDSWWKKEEILMTHSGQSSYHQDHTHSNSYNIRISHSSQLEHHCTVVEDLWVKKECNAVSSWSLLSSSLSPFPLLRFSIS